MNWARWANVILGIWLILSPFILGFVSNQATWNNIIVGFLVLVFAFVTRSTMETARGTT
jgi:site-specific recombinase